MRLIKAQDLRRGQYVLVGEKIKKIVKVGKLGEQRYPGEARQEIETDRVPIKLKGDRYDIRY